MPPKGGLFPCEAEIARRLSQPAHDWATQAMVLEREGLPRIDPLFGARYWPAVVEFLNRRSGLRAVGPVNVDGEETW